MLSLTSFFFFNDTATTEIYTLSLHDALPISLRRLLPGSWAEGKHQPSLPACFLRLSLLSPRRPSACRSQAKGLLGERSEEHTSELQSQSNLVCRLLLEKKKTTRAEPLDTWHR